MQVPNYIYLGYDKSGSTWLFNLLQAHPEVSVPASKETFYFDRNYDKGLDWYAGFFDSSKKVTLDISHDYIFSEEALQRIKNDLPDVKCILFVRNPIDKAWSLFNFAKRNGLVDSDLFRAIEAEPGIVERSLYFNQIKFAKELFGGNLAVFYFDELENDPELFYKKVADFLSIPAVTEVDLKTKVNEASKSRFKMLTPFLRSILQFLRLIGANKLIGFLKTNKLVHKILFKKEKKKLSQKEFEFLKGFFESDIKNLGELLDRDFSDWLVYKD